MIKKSYAKINLAINILKKLDNGYHELDMIMTKIDIFDKLYFSFTNKDEIILTCTNSFIPTDSKNLVYKVIDRMKKKYNITRGIRVHIAKTIPMQAGLGGGSSNAATTVEAMEEMFNLNLTLQEKIDLVIDLGADIPFFFFDQMARVSGIGDVIEPFDVNIDDFYVVLAKPQRGVSTKLAYENVNIETCPHPDIDRLIYALEHNDYDYLINNIQNSLEDSAIKIRPVIQDLKNELIKIGLDTTLVSGSGSTVFALTKNEDVVKRVKESHVNRKNFVYITKLLK